MKYYAIMTDGGPAFLQAKSLNAAFKMSDEGGLIAQDVYEIRSFLHTDEGMIWRAVDAHTEEIIATKRSLKALMTKLANL